MFYQVISVYLPQLAGTVFFLEFARPSCEFRSRTRSRVSFIGTWARKRRHGARTRALRSLKLSLLTTTAALYYRHYTHFRLRGYLGMSLQALPTELDVLIVRYLDTQDASQLTRVSKYWRRIGEPVLYANIRLYDDKEDWINALLDTLLKRRELAKHSLHHVGRRHKLGLRGSTPGSMVQELTGIQI
jgi:hypothetical protein